MSKIYKGKAWNDKFLPRLTSKQVTEISKEDAMVILPIGAVEQHGGHLPLYTDTLLTETILEEVYRYLPEDINIWLLPALPFSKSNEHDKWSGTLSLSHVTMQGILMDISKSIKRSGFKRLLFFNSHGGNHDLLKMMAREIRLETGLMVFNIFIGSLPLDETLFDERERNYGIHGGDFETSMIMATYPDWVQTEYISGEFPDQIENTDFLKFQQGNFSWIINDISFSGICGDASNASSEKGKATYKKHGKYISEMLVEMVTFEFNQINNKEG